MNEHIGIHQRPNEPLRPAPRKYTAADIFFFLEAGIIDENAEFELLDGEIVPMSPKGRHHEAMRERLMEWLRQPWASDFRMMVEHTLTISDRTILEPDFILYPSSTSIKDRQLTGDDMRLIIEVADSSLAYDLQEKALSYASFGADEYWVINAKTGLTHVHRGSLPQGWQTQFEVPAGQPLSPLCAPAAVLKL